GGGNITLVGSLLIKGVTSTTINASGHLISSGATVQGPSVTLGAGAAGIDPITTNATTLSVNTTGGGNADVTDTTAFMNLGASNVTGTLTVKDSANFATMNVTGLVNAAALNLTMQGTNSSITLASSITSTGTVTLSPSISGAVNQFLPTPLLTA